MKITKVEVFTCPQPLKIPFTHASSGLVTHLEGVYVRLNSDCELTGIGEVRGNCSYFTGDTTGAVVSTIVTRIAPALLGKDPRNINVLNRAIENSVVGCYGAKAACDAAVYDLAGRIAGVPVYELLGGKIRDDVVSEENIPFMSVEKAQDLAESILDGGCRFVKMRVGSPRFADDLERVSAVWEIIGKRGLRGDVTFSVDANQSWRATDAVGYVNRLAEMGVTIVEQPFPFNSIDRLLEFRRNCPIKLFGDEAATDIASVTRLIELNAVDGIHIKLIKCGGIYNAVRLMHLAEAHGIDYMIGGMDEGMLAVTAAVHCAAVANTDLFEVHGHLRIANDPTSGLVAAGSVVRVPDGPGLGVTVDESALRLEMEVKA